MKNTVLWGIQATVDRTYKVRSRMSQVISYFIEKELFPTYADTLKAILTTGLHKDYNFRLDPNDPLSLKHLDIAVKYLRVNNFIEAAQIGGNPGISALRAHRLSVGNPDSSLPQVQYIGLFPESVQEYVAKNSSDDPALKNVFNAEHCIQTQARPQTVSIEAEHKIILSYGPGRDLNDLFINDTFDKYITKLREASVNQRDGKVVVALSVPWPLDKGKVMLDNIRSEFRDRVSIFVSLAALRKDSGEVDQERVTKINEHILTNTDIISCNETELHDLHTMVVGGGTFQDIPLVYKLKQLPHKAIKICHSAYGSILDIGCDPQAIINSRQFIEDPGGYLKSALQLATDGATYAFDAEVGRKASESMVRIYSDSVAGRSVELFRATFLKTVEQLTGGVLAVHSPLVYRPMGALTGVGAMLDGLLVSFLMRD